MDPRTLSICFGAIALAAGGLFCGVKFCRKKNYLIGIEWFLLAISSTNFMVYELTHSEISYLGVMFLDTFSRAFGIPIVTAAGLMILTHRFRQSMRIDVILFIIPAAATLFLLTDLMAPSLPYFLLLMWTLFTFYLVYFSYQLLGFGERLQALGMLLAALSNQIIACMYDFYKIPGDETNVFLNFYTIALFVWTYLTVQTYYGYCALERAMDVTTVNQATPDGTPTQRRLPVVGVDRP